MPDERTRVLIAGGGVAGLGAILVLRDLAGELLGVILDAHWHSDPMALDPL